MITNFPGQGQNKSQKHNYICFSAVLALNLRQENRLCRLGGWHNSLKTLGMKKIAIINGPNLNLIGVREPEVYGTTRLDDYLATLKQRYAGVAQITYCQSNVEGVLIDEIHRVGFEVDGIVINAGAYTHTSIAIADAIRSVTAPVVEIHISNVHRREEYRHRSMLSGACAGVIVGFGLDSYRLAVEALLAM